LPEYAGGIGLDKRTVKRILHEMDLILIIGFGFDMKEKENEEKKEEN
jgi:thiamine pyrophosphate-dependent acetolactate synthase large subunit-like protein